MSKKINRREALKILGAGALSLPFISSSAFSQKSEPDEIFTFQPKPHGTSNGKKITAITCGAGARGNAYGNYAVSYPDSLDIVGVAEPIKTRIDRYSKLHNIPEENQFVTWEHVFERPKFADAIIITTPDDLHYGPCMEALKLGYDVLLEKPIAPTEKECTDILELAEKTGRIVAVCHVLRYAPYFIKMREMIQSGKVGELISIQHLEPIQHIHMSHSYVRGNWHNSKATTPIILAKSCHDLDIIRWMVDEPCKEIIAMGDLKWFRKENAPEGATPRCTGGCPFEPHCPYSALKIYYRDRTYCYVFDLPDNKEEHGDYIMDKLQTTNYGRCVYFSDNDQPDHYISSMQFENGVTANFSMEAFTSYHGRRTRVMGSMGDIVGDMHELYHTDFLTGKLTKWDITVEDIENYKNSGHGGGDWGLVDDWLDAIRAQDHSLLTSTIKASVESHVMGFRAEKSRETKKIEKLSL